MPSRSSHPAVSTATTAPATMNPSIGPPPTWRRTRSHVQVNRPQSNRESQPIRSDSLHAVRLPVVATAT